MREEIESEIRSFGLPVSGVDSLADAVRELENEETEYAGLIIHLGDPRRTLDGRRRVFHEVGEPSNNHPAGARRGTVRAGGTPRKARASQGAAHLEPRRAATRAQQLIPVKRHDFERSNAGKLLEGARHLARGRDHHDDEISDRDPGTCRVVRLLACDTRNELIVLVDVAPRDVQELDVQSCFEALGGRVAIKASGC